MSSSSSPAPRTLRFGDTELVAGFAPGSTEHRFMVNKEPGLLDAYLDLLPTQRGATIVELGIHEGGSTALIAMLAEPSRLVAVDLTPEPVAALEGFLARRGLRDVVRARYGVDQADADQLRAVIDEEVGSAPLDLVIDDASHRYGPTRASFEVLFPRLRPGGLFIIEDWNWEQRVTDALRDEVEDPDPQMVAMREALRAQLDASTPPLHTFAAELAVARASMVDGLGAVRIDPWWITVERGDGDLDPEAFRADSFFRDDFGVLAGEVS